MIKSDTTAHSAWLVRVREINKRYGCTLWSEAQHPLVPRVAPLDFEKASTKVRTTGKGGEKNAVKVHDMVFLGVDLEDVVARGDVWNLAKEKHNLARCRLLWESAME